MKKLHTITAEEFSNLAPHAKHRSSQQEVPPGPPPLDLDENELDASQDSANVSTESVEEVKAVTPKGEFRKLCFPILKLLAQHSSIRSHCVPN